MKLFIFLSPLTHKAALTALMALGAAWSPLAANHSTSHHSTNHSINHNEHRVDADSRLSGYSLEFELWNSIQNHNKDGLNELISPLFLGRIERETLDYDAEMARLKNLTITSFSMNNAVESQDEDIRIISYDLVADGPVPINDHRISVWQRKKHKHHQFFWQLISHSHFSINS